jgi:hypothetical protein
MVNGTLRVLFLTPLVGDFRARQIGVFTGSLLIFLVACILIRWIGAESRRQLLSVGVGWLVLTVAFELLAGRFVFGRSWEDLGSDYAIWRGGLLPIGLVVLTLAPLVAARLRSNAGPDTLIQPRKGTHP